MNIILWIVLGLVAGWLASVITRRSSQGVLMDIILGVLGAIVGGLLISAFGGVGITGFNLYSLLVAVIGAVVLIGIGRMFKSY